MFFIGLWGEVAECRSRRCIVSAQIVYLCDEVRPAILSPISGYNNHLIFCHRYFIAEDWIKNLFNFVSLAKIRIICTNSLE